MAFFGNKKRSDVLDLSRGYKAPVKREKAPEEVDLTKSSPSATPFGSFFNSSQNNTGISSSEEMDSPEEKRKKLAKRLVDMTDRIEELDNKLYHLQQRIEVLEKKEGLSGFENSNNFNGNGLAF